MSSASATPTVRAAKTIKAEWLARQDYEPLWRRMQQYTDDRNENSLDRLWLTEHPPVFTLGLAAKREHLLAPGDIPVVQIDRGGEVTYHGPGQLMLYPLIDIRRTRIGVRELVTALENTVIEYCAVHGIEAKARMDAPGVYVESKKLASVGLRIRRGASYHGLAFNIAMDLAPFQRINPCGYQDLVMTDLNALGVVAELETVAADVATIFAAKLDFIQT